MTFTRSVLALFICVALMMGANPASTEEAEADNQLQPQVIDGYACFDKDVAGHFWALIDIPDGGVQAALEFLEEQTDAGKCVMEQTWWPVQDLQRLEVRTAFEKHVEEDMVVTTDHIFILNSARPPGYPDVEPFYIIGHSFMMRFSWKVRIPIPGVTKDL